MEQYIQELLTKLTLEEKIGMIHGAGLFRTAPVERLSIPAFHFSDGPMGVRGEYYNDLWRYLDNNDDFVTYLPCNSALASTWNRELARETGSVLGEEARGRGKDMILAPGINIKRTPLCGRNFEYLSEDPYLTGEFAAQLVQGIQTHDVAACVKHFAANAQETDRLWVDTQVDEKTLREIYFPGFRAAVEAGTHGVMGAYNLLNGEHCCTGKRLLGDVLREDWGFDGMIVSDWGGVHDTVLAAESPLDVEMNVKYDFDRQYMAQPLLEAIRRGEIDEEKVDRKVRNILRTMYRLKMIGPEKDNRSCGAYNTPAHREAAARTAEESVILLKNQGVLPLKKEKVRTLAVIGGNAVTLHAMGGGSAEIRALYEISPLMGIKMLLGGNTHVSFAPGYGVPQTGSRPEISWQASSTQEGAVRPAEPVLTEERVAEAVELARNCDAVIYVGGLNHDYDTEGLDRPNMKLPYGQDALIEALLEARPDTVVVLYAGSPVEMPWLDRAQTLLWCYYAGMEGGSALAKVIFGEVNPSGHLAETFLRTAQDCPAAIANNRQARFTEGTDMGYRHYDSRELPVNFPFGHGLSYTEFALGDGALEGNTLSVTLTNTGSLPGAQVVQLYIGDGKHHWLRGFKKCFLEAGMSRTLRFTLTEADFSEFDPAARKFVPVSGEYTLELGFSSRDIRVKVPFSLE